MSRAYMTTPATEWAKNEAVAFSHLMLALQDAADDGKPAYCAGLADLWEHMSTERQIDQCDGCPVLAACRNYAEYSPSASGVWGGKLYYGSARKS
jgi:transcription factor WhiB